MTLNSQQQEGLDIAVKRFTDGEPYTVIAGLPGTGKTYLAVKIVEALGFNRRDYEVATFTGKAASVLQQRGLPAKTLHKLLYKTVPIEGTDDFIHIPKNKGDINTKILIIDEISMVPNNILKQAAKHGIHILALGDPNQLPPIGEDNGLLKNPHIFLTQIMRQAEGNSIILFARKLLEIKRYNDKIEWRNDDMVKVVQRADVVDGMFGWADQIICSRNETRRKLNQEVRKYHGFSGEFPQEGEKVIFTRNDWKTMNAEKFPIVNGMTGEVLSTEKGFGAPFPETNTIDFKSDFTNAPFKNLHYSTSEFLEGSRPEMGLPGKKRINSIDFGYVITAHKSQGSEYGNLLVFEESLRSNIDLAILFTAATRAKLKLVLVQNPQRSFIKVY